MSRNLSRRWIVIDSAKRNKVDWYDIEYEQIPHFCFSCGRLGHSDLYCPTLSTRDENGDLPFKPSLRASEDQKQASSANSTMKERQETHNSTRESRSSSSKQKQQKEVTSPVKTVQNKRKGGPQLTQVYKPVAQKPTLTITQGQGEDGGKSMEGMVFSAGTKGDDQTDGSIERDPKKNKPTPPSSENSASAASQPCLSQ